MEYNSGYIRVQQETSEQSLGTRAATQVNLTQTVNSLAATWTAFLLCCSLTMIICVQVLHVTDGCHLAAADKLNDNIS